KHGNSVTFQPTPDYRLRRNDHLVLLGEENALRHFTERL
ncbi:MAG: TrkA family potassium uptake protein, partial [Alcanivorax sp.]|nr:TrkA family potassium uptake protein [Alcanivorax sp.]